MRHVVGAVAAMAVLALGLTSCGGDPDGTEEAVDEPTESATPTPTPTPSASEADTIPLAQAVVIVSDVVAMVDDTPPKCEQSNRFQGIGAGDQMELLDAAGATVSLADLEVASDPDLPKPPKFACVWTATFSEVPASGDFYKVRLGKWTSDAVAEADLATQRFVLSP